MDLILNIIVWLIIAGFIYWAIKLLIGLIPMDAWFKQIVEVLLLIFVVAIVLFKVILPLIGTIAHLSTGFSLH